MLSEEEKVVLKKLFEEVIQAKGKSDIRLKINKQVAQYLLNCINSLEQLETNNKKVIEYIEKKMCEYDETIIELVLQNILAVAKGENQC